LPIIGFHCSHEQIGPRRLLDDVRHAEAAGFEAAMCSDHIDPWSHRQGHSGNAWSWLGAALATTSLPFGVVTTTGFRYHPAVTAQATASLAAMFPERFWFALGSGEHCNERVSGIPWPGKEQRQQRLADAFEIVRRLHAGETVTHTGPLSVDRAKVWDLPPIPPPMLLPALTPQTAERFAGCVDGIITANAPKDDLRRLLDAYRSGGGTGRVVLQVHLSWADTADQAFALAHEQWLTNVFPPPVMADLATPEEFEARTGELTDRDLADAVQISADPTEHADRLAEYLTLGFDEIYLHHVGKDQTRFIDVFADAVLPQLA
jgi:coenzyme F420-dependent glucose-6-phosphate dehydrogenase